MLYCVIVQWSNFQFNLPIGKFQFNSSSRNALIGTCDGKVCTYSFLKEVRTNGLTDIRLEIHNDVASDVDVQRCIISFFPLNLFEKYCFKKAIVFMFISK